MPFLFNDDDLTRKFRIIKQNLYNDGFYRDKIVCRVITTTGGDDIYDRDAEIEITDTVINGIVEPGPIFNTYNNMIEVENGDIKLTVRNEDSTYIDNANEVWVGCVITNGVPKYDDDELKTLTQGIVYKIKSKKTSIQNLDDIYIMGMKGNLGT